MRCNSNTIIIADVPTVCFWPCMMPSA